MSASSSSSSPSPAPVVFDLCTLAGRALYRADKRAKLGVKKDKPAVVYNYTKTIYELIDAASEPEEPAERALLYESPPHIARPHWTALGERIAAAEHAYLRPRADQCYTLRLDVTGMSTIKRKLVADGTFSARWCPAFRDIMLAVAKDLAQAYGARWCFTQSDEITLVVVPPQPAGSNPGFQHVRGGKQQKLVTLSAARASALATTLLTQLRERRAAERVPWWCPRWLSGVPVPAPVQLEFDCRMAVWESERDAFQLVLWRAYDCTVNGLTDAVCNQRGRFLSSSVKIPMEASGQVKLEWLERHGLLPLPHHQAYGTLLRCMEQPHTAFDPAAKQNVKVMRKQVVEMRINNVITAIKRGQVLESV